MHHFKAVAVLSIVIPGLVCSGQQAPDPSATLRQAKERLLADLDRMPRYTCVQTVTRTYLDARSGASALSCPALIAARNARRHSPPAFQWDRLRLEVAWVDGNNLYSWIGEPRFASDNLEKLAGEGPLGSGDFGALLREILLRTNLNFEREQVINDKRLLEYSYEMPLEKSTYRVKASDGWKQIGYSGTVLLDPASADLVTLTMRTAELPLSSSSCQANSEITYGRTSIHNRAVLIPRETRLDVMNIQGTESLSRTTFTNCREYASTVRFPVDDSKSPAGPNSATTAPDGSPEPLPAGLHFGARIITPIDSDTAAAGDPIEAILRSPIHGKNKVLIAPAGARIHGRLVGVRWRSEPAPSHQITVQFEFIKIDGRRVPLNAVLEPPHAKVLTGTGVSASRIVPPTHDDTSPGATFSFPQEHVRLKNLDAQWVTVALGTVAGQK